MVIIEKTPHIQNIYKMRRESKQVAAKIKLNKKDDSKEGNEEQKR